MVLEKRIDHASFRRQIDCSLRRLMSELNRDECAPAYGCFDRRYWGWKLIDFPEATFQRNIYPLAWALLHSSDDFFPNKTELQTAIIAGLQYTFQIQHNDGSFDQAFPNEHSYGATAFLLHPLLETYKIVQDAIDPLNRKYIEHGLIKAANFLCSKSETHGLISNHLAGAGLSLLLTGTFFNNKNLSDHGLQIVNAIIRSQDPEGWYPEYGGADPGYQTLCLYYLAQVYRYQPSQKLKRSLERAVQFLAWFIHPDGSFGGEYGSRRTSIYYPGGIALLAEELPIAANMSTAMIDSIIKGKTATLWDIDMGNLAPLLQNYILAHDNISPNISYNDNLLPCDQHEISKDFINAGISVRGNNEYYAILGVANGGVLKIFNKKIGINTYDDAGYYGKLQNGRFISTQSTKLDRPCKVDYNSISLEVTFVEMLRSIPSPFQFILLRIANITFMRSIWMGNLIKSILVQLLIRGERQFPIRLKRTVHFHDKSIEIIDLLEKDSNLKLLSLDCGKPFISIHMASTRYFQGQSPTPKNPLDPVDITKLEENGQITRRIEI